MAHFLHLNSKLPVTFGGVGRFILSRILESHGQVILFIADKWNDPSIKNCEELQD